MKIEYNSKKLEKSLTIDKEISKTYGTLAKKIKQRITQLNSAENLSVIQKLPQLRLHLLGGDKKGIWSIDIHQNWRILFIPQEPMELKEDGGIDLGSVVIISITSVEDTH